MTGSTVTVRPSRDLSDIRAAAVVRARSWARAYRGILSDAVLDAMRPDDPAYLREAENRFRRMPPGWHHLVAERDRVVVGFVTCGPERIDHRVDRVRGQGTVAGSIGEVYALYVDPTHWSAGAGSALLEAARATLAADGYVRISLWVLEDNGRARAFYERRDLVPTGDRKAFTVARDSVPEVRYEGPILSLGQPVRRFR